VYHLELRHFPHHACSFNLTEQQLRALVEPWAHDQVVELAERKWSPHIAKLTILEGPRLPVQQLSMGRGWRNAERQSEDVTERVLAAAKALGGSSTLAPTEPSAGASSSELDLQVDSLGLGILSLLDSPAPLWRAWLLAQARFPERSASESLDTAEHAVRSLLERRLIVLLQVAKDAPDGARAGGETVLEVSEELLEPLLRAVESWTATGGSEVRMRRR
jgi:hypothetical protein